MPTPRSPSAVQRRGVGLRDLADGFIVTNNTSSRAADQIEIEFYSGETLPAEVVGTDPNTDVPC